MFKNIAFVGGIHGVGKSTICKKICDELNITYLSASDVLKWKAIKKNYKDKKVEDIPYTQNQLILGLKGLIKDNQYYLLDGHFCLWDKQNNISKIPKEVFQEINPLCLSVVIDEVSEIKNRLERRDNLPYVYTKLEEMQLSEIEHAKTIASHLKTSFF
ncbi:ATP-binding protein [Pedobacter sp. P26]|uniref:ATP-binding protein n=1 Tax=Pedobacter sp. P26 TaxID=3423956 RepID=UPI003D67C376